MVEALASAVGGLCVFGLFWRKQPGNAAVFLLPFNLPFTKGDTPPLKGAKGDVYTGGYAFKVFCFRFPLCRDQAPPCLLRIADLCVCVCVCLCVFMSLVLLLLLELLLLPLPYCQTSNCIFILPLFVTFLLDAQPNQKNQEAPDSLPLRQEGLHLFSHLATAICSIVSVAIQV